MKGKKIYTMLVNKVMLATIKEELGNGKYLIENYDQSTGVITDKDIVRILTK